MRKTLRWLVAIVIILHGLIHLLGAAKGLGWTEVDQLTGTVTVPLGLAWLIAAVLTTTAGVLVALRAGWWWAVTAAAAVTSQALIFTAWDDAKAGTLANLVMLVAAAYGYASQGPTSLRAEYRRRARAALCAPAATAEQAPDGPGERDVVTEADLDGLPEPVAGYLRRSGAVGRPRITGFHATVRGRIRGGPTKPWMAFTGEQSNLYGPNPSRLFRMDATMMGVPVDVLHVFADGHATMRVKLCSLLRMVDASGPDMDRAETVTLFNDLCVMAPAALIDAPISWRPIDDHRAEGTYTASGQTVTAELVFDNDHNLIDFVSDDRLRSSQDGRSFTPQRWSTPLGTIHHEFDGRRLPASGQAYWHAPAPEGTFSYLEFDIVDLTYQTATGAQPPTTGLNDDATDTAVG